MKRIATTKPLPDSEPVRHKVACKNCPSAHFAPDPECLDIQKLPHAERVKTGFPCGWNPKRYCKGYCEQMGIADEDLKREFSERTWSKP